MADIIDERPRTPLYKIKDSKKDILIDGFGIIARMEVGPLPEEDDPNYWFALVSTKPGSDFLIFYPNLLPVPKQVPEVYKIRALKDLWVQVNVDSRCGSWILLESFDGRPTAMTELNKTMLDEIEILRFRDRVNEAEKFRLLRELEYAKEATGKEIIRQHEIYRRVRDSGFIPAPPEDKE